jgi:CheY-like chemotaxis protein
MTEEQDVTNPVPDADSAQPGAYVVACANCQAQFNALDVPWCSCLVTERSLVCPSCLKCFCKAPLSYKRRFWSGAPRVLWDAKWREHNAAFAGEPNPEPGAVTRPLVLVVEDEPDIQRMARRAVNSLGYGMILGRNGLEGMELAQKYQPDLILTDALMPKLDGREMSGRLKRDPTTRHIKVVVMTALYTSVKHQTEAYRNQHVDEYLAKPLEFAQLRAVLQKQLG